MGTVAYLPTQEAVEAAWERYRSLMAAANDDRRLLTDRHHMETMARAERAWKAAFFAWADAK